MPAQPGTRVAVELVGPLTAVVDGRRLTGRELGSRKARTVLGVLAAAGDVLVPADRLVDAAWPERPPARPGAELAILVSRLRAVLGSAAISGSRAAYRLDRHRVSVDVEDAARLLDEAGRRAGEPALAAAAAAGALSLLERGEPAADDPYAGWADVVREHVAALRRRGRLAEAAGRLATAEPELAWQLAQAATEADPLDEEACRLLMRAAAALGRDAAALAAYESLRAGLAEALGADPSAATRELHQALLEGRPLLAALQVTSAPARSRGIVGRERELDLLAEGWRRTVAGEATLLLLCGEPGIGKTTVAQQAAEVAAGALVLQARCFEAERSLFLQPLVEAIGNAVATLPSSVVADAVVERPEVLAGLVPEVAAVRPAPRTTGQATPDAGRRQAYDAITGFLRRLARHRPLVLLVDDLHNAGLATVDLLHYLVRVARDTPLMIVATVRSDEGAEAIARLAPVATRVSLAPLDERAVARLVEAAGQTARLPEIMASTAGHPLFVVETLRGLLGGDEGISPTLQDSVLARVARTGRDAEALLRAAAVLGATFEPADLAALTGVPLLTVARTCEEVLASRLLVVAGRSYAFAYDVAREVLYRTTPEPSRVAHHSRAADLMSDRPEVMAGHAAAAGDERRAARAWLLAGEQALARYAASDAEALLDKALAVLDGLDEPALIGRCLLGRGRTREAQLSWSAAIDDYRAAETLGHESGDQRLQMAALWQLGWDSLTASGSPISAPTRHISQAGAIARTLGDRAFEARALSRLAVLAANDLDFVAARSLGEQATELGRRADDDEALVAGLDGLKTSYAYVADLEGLQPVLDELIPLVRRRQDVVRLQWAIFESSFAALASGDWAAATMPVEEALGYSRGRGSAAYEAWFLAHLGWVARLQGRTDDALAHGRHAIDVGCQSEPTHAWCWAMAAVTYATTLLRAGRRDEAAAVLAANRESVPEGQARAYRARFAAAQAEATGDPAARREAETLLAGVTTPPGSAWLLGWDAYVSLAAAQHADGDVDLAAATLSPLVDAAQRIGWTPVLLDVRHQPPAQSRPASSSAARAAPSVSTGR